VTLTANNSASGIGLTWPSFANGFALESSLSLDPGAIWNPLGGAPVITNGVFQQIVIPSDDAQFYRLKR